MGVSKKQKPPKTEQGYPRNGPPIDRRSHKLRVPSYGWAGVRDCHGLNASAELAEAAATPVSAASLRGPGRLLTNQI